MTTIEECNEQNDEELTAYLALTETPPLSDFADIVQSNCEDYEGSW